MNNFVIILGILMISAFVIFMNVCAVKYIRRVVLVKRRTEITKGRIIEFDNIHSLKVEYSINDIYYCGECNVLFVKGNSPNIIGKDGKISYSVGDEVDVYYDSENPSRFLIDGGSAFYKARSFQIFFLDAALLALAALCLFMHFGLGL
ncbi:MAG: DUF3592 domain-containing protein [Oscillospiraceae bacterium]|nr:DUF3592 domain-containing protein [Oscillospiraceae bacterium]